MKIGLFRKKPVVIEAAQLGVDYDTDCEIMGWCGGEPVGDIDEERDYDGAIMVIPTLEGEMRAEPGDWIIKGVKGEFYPCKPDIFEATYEQFGEVAEGKLGETLERLFPEGSQVDG